MDFRVPATAIAGLLILSASLLGVPASGLAAAHIATHVVISEVFYDQLGDADNFVELYNPTASALSLAGWSIVGLDGATGTAYVTIALSGAIPSEGFFLVGADASVFGVAPDVVYSGLDLDEGGTYGDGVKLVNAQSQLVDYVAYGGVGNPLVSLEGTPFRDVIAGHSIERRSSTTHVEAFGNGEDTNQNIVDWRERLRPQPRNSASPTEPPMPYQTEILTIMAFNVGMADAGLIVAPGGESFLIDGGNNGVGAGKIVPFLRAEGIDTLSYMGASHYDADHIGGLDEVIIQGIKVAGGCWDRGWSYSTSTYNDYAGAVAGMRHTYTKNQVFDLGRGCTVKCVALNGNGQLGQPYTDPPWAENDLSVALYLSFYGFQFFTAGDLSGYDDETYEDIETSVAAEITHPVDVYKVSHHGSWKSSNAAMMEALSPEASIFSVGSNSTGHPHAEAMARIWAVGSYMYFTDWVNGDAIPPGTGTDVEDDIQVATDGINFFAVHTDIYSFPTEVVETGPVFPAAGLRVVQWPNPATQWTDLLFSAEGSRVPSEVSVYDVAGRCVDRLTPTGGLTSGEFRWWVGDRPAGVYFYRAETDGAVSTGKVIVVK